MSGGARPALFAGAVLIAAAAGAAAARPPDPAAPIGPEQPCEISEKVLSTGARWRKPVNVGWVGFDEAIAAALRREIKLIAAITGLKIDADRSRPVNNLILSARSPDQLSDRLVGAVGRLSGGEERGREIVEGFARPDSPGRRINYGMRRDILSAILFLPKEGGAQGLEERALEALYVSFGALARCQGDPPAEAKLDFYRRALFRIYAGAGGIE